jgi:hypothetical protein
MRLKILIASAATSALLLTAAPSALAFNFFSGQPNDVCNSQTQDNRVDPNSSPICKSIAKQKNTINNPIVHAIQVTTSIMALLSGFVAVIMVIIAGFQFVTSGGSDEAVANAKKRIRSAIIGLILVAIAWTLVRLVTDAIIK